jgi:phospholipid/cholesterol/gamma-HCH transport system substrate-binding protein
MEPGRAPPLRRPPTGTLMDRDANYVAVGAFVLLVVGMALSFVLWYTNQKDKHVYLRYEIYFPGSVSGLSPGGPVRYLGVDVGKVARILIDPQQRNRVLVIADIEATAPIDGRTRASLSLQGITGLLFIDLSQDHKSTAPALLPEGLRYPVIPSVPSDFDVLLSNLPQLAAHLVELVERFNQVFSDDNVRAFNATLNNVRLTSERLPGTVRDVQELLADVRRAAAEVQGAAAELRSIETHAAPDVESALANARVMSENLLKTSDRLERFVAENEPGLSRFTQQSLPELEQLLRESRQAARDFRDLSRSLKQNPSQLIYEPNYRGVEVAK